MTKTLIIRNYRLGDAIITLPIIYDLAIKYPQDTFYIMTDDKLAIFLDQMPDNIIHIHGFRKGSSAFRSVSYFFRKRLYYYKIRKQLLPQIQKLALLQDNNVNKKRILKYAVAKNIQIEGTDEAPFTSPERLKIKFKDDMNMYKLHIQTFERLGYVGIKENFDFFDPARIILNRDLEKEIGLNNNKKIIAIAPFSQEKQKIYPIEQMEQIASKLADRYQIIILGGGNKEKEIVDKWNNKNIVSLINKVDFKEEVKIISKCSLVVTMDSANLHLANLLKIPCLSIWGPTSPENGYLPNKDRKKCYVIKNLNCQPCSLFGDTPCNNPDYLECMNIPHTEIIEKIESLLL